MPQFVLQELKYPLGRPTPKMIFTKGVYCDKVKMPGWERVKECEPKDNDPYLTGDSNFLSTYNRIGHEKEKDHFLTTTKMFYEKINHKDEILLEDDGIRYMPLRNTTSVKPLTCAVGQGCAPEYLTTMQESYKIPFVGVLRPLSFPKIPFPKYRRVQWLNTGVEPTKFMDDCYIYQVRTTTPVKSHLCNPYNPITHYYLNGTPYKPQKKDCVKLSFEHVK